MFLKSHFKYELNTTRNKQIQFLFYTLKTSQALLIQKYKVKHTINVGMREGAQTVILLWRNSL